MNKAIPVLVTATLAMMGVELARAFAREGSMSGSALKIGGAAGGIYLAGKALKAF